MVTLLETSRLSRLSLANCGRWVWKRVELGPPCDSLTGLREFPVIESAVLVMLVTLSSVTCSMKTL